MGPRPPICQKSYIDQSATDHHRIPSRNTHPALGLVVLPRAKGIGDLVILIVAVDQVLHDSAALE
jgi:hypothetical protein